MSRRRFMLSLVAICLLVLACGPLPVTPTRSAIPTASPTSAATPGPKSISIPSPIPGASPTATAMPSGTPSPTSAPTNPPTGLLSIELEPVGESSISGTLVAFDNGDGTTTLTAELPGASAIYPWSLHPGFDCGGVPAEDTQLAVALPDIENGSSSEVVDSATFTTPLGVVVFALTTEAAAPVACGVLPPLDWAAIAPPSPAPTHDPGVPSAIASLVDAMESAVLAGDADAYLALVDRTDPVFAVEHARWVDDWSGPNPVDEFDLTIAEIMTLGKDATGRLAITWAAGGQPTRTASIEVQFVSVDGEWRYAGESWVTEELDRFRIRVAPGLESEIAAIAADLPDVYEHVTDSLDYEPGVRMEIKVYTDASALVATTLLSLPDIHGWNEPGEALKVRLDPLVISLTPAIAHEFTHFCVFDRADTQRSLMPWWLDEGLATHVAEPFGEPGSGDDRLATVRDWASEGSLADWSEMSVFETTPQALWPYVYSQGYALVRFVTETYGVDQRNEWLEAMATESAIDPATEQNLGLTFPELAADFEAWLLG